MKILTIPDLHGKDIWAKVDFTKYDKVIFLGDYVDSFTHTDKEILDNLRAIIEFKKANESKVELLLGNHDIQYLYQRKYRCSGHRISMDEMLHKEFSENESLFKNIFQIGLHVWSHAGISNSWFNEVEPILKVNGFERDSLNIEEGINILAKQDFNKLVMVSKLRGGYDQESGIFWADKSELEKDNLVGIHQYVGHTHVKTINFKNNNGWKVYFLDCLDTVPQFLEIELPDSSGMGEGKFSLLEI
ncbi:MAG: metallophosphoesterase [Bacteroidota bacterium]|nr:metallophosphoesterase [Bacteroidota bacterium]